MMSTGASWGILSTNDGPLFWSSEKLAALGCRQCCGQGHCTNAPRPHGCGQHVFTGIRKLRRQAGGEAGCSEGRDDVEQYEIERCLGELQEEMDAAATMVAPHSVTLTASRRTSAGSRRW